MRNIRFAFALCGLLLVAAAIFNWSAEKPTGMVVNGQTISNSELSSGAKEALDLLASIQDKGSSASGQQPVKTQLGQLVKDLAAKGDEIEEWHTTAMKGRSLGELLDPKVFKSPLKLQDALKGVDELEDVEAEWIRRRKSLMDSMYESLGRKPSLQARAQENGRTLDNFLLAEKAVFQDVRTYLQLGLEKSPVPDVAKGIVYWSDRDLPEAQRILGQIDAHQKEVVRQDTAMREIAAQGIKALDEVATNPQ